jgi:hypothetical protein
LLRTVKIPNVMLASNMLNLFPDGMGTAHGGGQNLSLLVDAIRGRLTKPMYGHVRQDVLLDMAALVMRMIHRANVDEQMNVLLSVLDQVLR